MSQGFITCSEVFIRTDSEDLIHRHWTRSGLQARQQLKRMGVPLVRNANGYWGVTQETFERIAPGLREKARLRDMERRCRALSDAVDLLREANISEEQIHTLVAIMYAKTVYGDFPQIATRLTLIASSGGDSPTTTG